MGPSGSGKSHYLYEWVTKESMEHPEKNYIVLVPEQFTMQTQRDFVVASPRKGILNVEVLSFNRLAHRVFEETGGTNRIVLDDVGKNLVIRKVAGDNEEKLKVLGGNLKKMGYISEMKSIISEFTQYNIGTDALEEMLTRAEKYPNLLVIISTKLLFFIFINTTMKKKHLLAIKHQVENLTTRLKLVTMMLMSV